MSRWINPSTPPAAHRETARASFHSVAALYDEARPGYPHQAFDDLVTLTKLTSGSHLLEIGSGTGHATLPLAEHGFHIDCIELGEEMAFVARAKLAAFPRVTITVADFDNWHSEARYDLALSASAWHWLNPATRTPRIAELLAHQGRIATLRNIHVQSDAIAAFLEATQRIYAELVPALAQEGIPRAEEIFPIDAHEWESSGLFHNAQTRTYRWQSKQSAEEYVQMLNTHSDHRMMAADVREQLFARLRELIEGKFSGVATKEYVTLLQMAEKAI